MRKFLTSLVLLAVALCAHAQDTHANIEIGEAIPPSAAEILQPRLVQMLEAGGVADAPLQVSAVIGEQMDTPGSMSQVALSVNLVLRSGEVEETFPLKGVGNTLEDAWQRAVKQFLPRSKAAQNFVKKLSN